MGVLWSIKEKKNHQELDARSCSRGTGLLGHERVSAIRVVLHGSGLMLCCDNNGVFIYKLTGGIGESRQGQGDPLHLTLIDPLLVLLLQVLTPKGKHKT